MINNADVQRVNNKLIVVVTINIFQPIERELLMQRLNSRIDSEQLSIIIEELVSENRIIFEQGRFRLTRKGYKAILPDKGRVLRDVNRMHYLADTNFQRGGGP